MSYQFWPSGTPPYQAYTHITDRVTPVNHQSIMDGVARDIGSLMHNINTTNLFVSGYLQPIVSGYFKNLDTNYLYANNIQTRSLVLYNLLSPNISAMAITGTSMNVSDSAFRNNNIKVGGSWTGPSGFNITSNGFTYTPAYVSGGLYDYYLSHNRYVFLNTSVSKRTDIVSGNLVIDRGNKVLLENLGFFAPSGSISESGILWNPSAGHDHIDNRIMADDILDADVTYQGDLVLNSPQGSIYAGSGILDADVYDLQTYYDSIGFYELPYTASGTYTTNAGYNGFTRDLGLGIDHIISYNGLVYATSKVLPTGTVNTNHCFIYHSEDLHTWSGVLVTGTREPTASGIKTVDGFAINDGKLWFLWNYKMIKQAVGSSGNFCGAQWIEQMNDDPFAIASGFLFFGNSQAHYSSKYALGIASVHNNVVVYGYEYPHIAYSGIAKWDKHCLYYNAGNQVVSTTVSNQDLSYSGVPYKYSFPFIVGSSGNAIDFYSTYFWLDGTYSGREPYLTSADNNDAFTMLYDPTTFPGPEPSSFFAGFFGNGFSEITSMLSTDLTYHNGQRSIWTHRLEAGVNHVVSHGDLIENYAEAPLLVFGNSTVAVNTSSSGTIFGGCIPLVMNIDKRFIYGMGMSDHILTSGNMDFAPSFFHGSRSLMDNETLLWRIPSYMYYDGGVTANRFMLMNSNIFQERSPNSGRLWTDYTFDLAIDEPTYRAELINLCPMNPGLLTVPFGGSGQLYYKHDSDLVASKLSYTSISTSGIIIPSSTFLLSDHRNYPTYFDRPIKDGFWSEKTFDWWYMSPSGYAPAPPSGAYPKSYYYMRPIKPIQHNGIVYCILEKGTGFVYIGPNGSEYVDDEIMYSDLIKYGNTIYGIGTIPQLRENEYTFSLVITVIKRNVSTRVNIFTGIGTTTSKFFIHNGVLYAGIGDGRFLAKKPAHTDLCITSNL